MEKLHQMDNSVNYIKVYLRVEEDNDGIIESIWCEVLSKDVLIVRNVPFYAFNVSYGDHIKVKHKDEALFFDKVISRSGHSTYRIYLKGLSQDEFVERWFAFNKLGCTYEKAAGKLFALDVPPSSDVSKVYKLLNDGEEDGLWEFEEAHCFSPQSNE